MPCKSIKIGIRAIAMLSVLAAGSTAWAKPLPSQVLEEMQRRTFQKRAEVNRRMLHLQAELEQAREDLAKVEQIAEDEGWSEERLFIALGDAIQRVAELEMDLEGIDAMRMAIRRHLDWIEKLLIYARQLEGDRSQDQDSTDSVRP